ncbi:hypothetical protein BJV78DRAFT_1229155 [Lactifluus subvellereus]|nr:hypothetical protein BJV78DRAFT_1229155 [Lactifluus subvellereus]
MSARSCHRAEGAPTTPSLERMTATSHSLAFGLRFKHYKKGLLAASCHSRLASPPTCPPLRLPPLTDYSPPQMFLFDFFAKTARSFRTTNSSIEDSDDESDASMSLTDTTSEADILEANDDMTVSAPDCMPSVSTAPNVGPNHSLSSPTSQYTASLGDEQPMSDSHATRSSDRRGVLRSARSSPRHNAYTVPSREQRETFKKHCRLRKHIFVNGSLDPFVSSAPTTVSSAFDDDQASSETKAASVSKKLAEPYLSTLFAAQCNIMMNQYAEMDSASNLMTPARTSNKSGLTIKIPGLIDRLALRLLGSCNVTEQTGEDEDTDSLDGYSASASESSSDDDGDCADFNFSAQSSDRFSRRKLRRHAIAPYHRAGKPKRKEWWLSRDEETESEVPAFLLTPSATESRARKLRSGRPY